MSIVLITGGAGFIGCRLVSRLVTQGNDVHVVDNFHPQVHGGRGVPAELSDLAVLHPADVVSSTSWNALLQVIRPDTVVHLAAETGTGQSLREAGRHASVNVLGTAAMLDALSAADRIPAHIVLASSRAVYGEGVWRASDGTLTKPGPRSHAALLRQEWDPIGIDGGALVPQASIAGITEPRPSNIYAATKLAQEHVLAAWCAGHESALSVLRFQNVYGPGQSVTNPYTGVLAFFVRTALQGGTIDVFEDGNIIRDFVHVDDIVDGLDAAITQVPNGTRTLDLGSGRPTTILKVSNTVAELASAPRPVVSGHFRDGDVRAASCEIADAHREIGYSPRVGLAEGLSSVMEWMQQTGLLDQTT